MDFQNAKLELQQQNGIQSTKDHAEDDQRNKNQHQSETTAGNDGTGGKMKSLGVRHLQALILFFAYFTSFFLRLNLSVAVVSMTDRNSSNPDFKEYPWDESTKSAILSSFFWGYLVSQAPAGQLAQTFSPKMLLLITQLLMGLLGALTPFAADKGGPYLLCAIRVAQGLFQGFLLPITYNLASRWAPLTERNRFVGFSLNGGTLGATVVFPVCGILASSSGGWPSIFYVSAVMSIVWSIVWAFLGADSPAKHKWISKEERQFIESSLAETTSLDLKTPWKSIFTSIPVYALICAHLGNGWGFAVILTQMPSYINSVLGFDITANGFLSALPYMSMWLLSYPVCWIADVIKERKIMSDTASRKMWTTFAESGSAICLICLGFVGRDATAAVVLLTICVSLSSCIFSGYNINHLDLAPNYAGVLVGIANGLENITTILGPLSVGWFVHDITSVDDWRLVFIVTACVAVTGNILFLIFGTAKVQPWNDPKSPAKRNDNGHA